MISVDHRATAIYSISVTCICSLCSFVCRRLPLLAGSLDPSTHLPLRNRGMQAFPRRTQFGRPLARAAEPSRWQSAPVMRTRPRLLTSYRQQRTKCVHTQLLRSATGRTNRAIRTHRDRYGPSGRKPPFAADRVRPVSTNLYVTLRNNTLHAHGAVIGSPPRKLTRPRMVASVIACSWAFAEGAAAITTEAPSFRSPAAHAPARPRARRRLRPQPRTP